MAPPSIAARSRPTAAVDERERILDAAEELLRRYRPARATVADRHVQHLCAQVRRILEDGVAEGASRLRDPQGAAIAVLKATLRFHHPANEAVASEAAARRMLALPVAGLAAGVL